MRRREPYDWKFWRYRDEVDAAILAVAISPLVIGLIAFVVLVIF